MSTAVTRRTSPTARGDTSPTLAGLVRTLYSARCICAYSSQFAGNGGNGGLTTTGNAQGGSGSFFGGGFGGNAVSGNSGNANGGSSYNAGGSVTNKYGSGNGGNGGQSSSGSATGGHAKRGGYYPIFFPGVGGSAQSGNSGNVNGGDSTNIAYSPWGSVTNAFGSGEFFEMCFSALRSHPIYR